MYKALVKKIVQILMPKSVIVLHDFYFLESENGYTSHDAHQTVVTQMDTITDAEHDVPEIVAVATVPLVNGSDQCNNAPYRLEIK